MLMYLFPFQSFLLNFVLVLYEDEYQTLQLVFLDAALNPPPVLNKQTYVQVFKIPYFNQFDIPTVKSFFIYIHVHCPLCKKLFSYLEYLVDTCTVFKKYAYLYKQVKFSTIIFHCSALCHRIGEDYACCPTHLCIFTQ